MDRPPKPTIDSSDDFRTFGKKLVDIIADYHDKTREFPVLPDVRPGYLSRLLPTEASDHPESWESICKDFDTAILPGMTHFNSPHFHAYFPTANNYASLMGDMLSDAFSCIGFSWIASPACTELEMITMDWLAKSLGMPEAFHHSGPGQGGGVIQGSMSETILIAMLAAKHRMLEKHNLNQVDAASKLVAYGSKQAHSSLEKGARIAGTQLRLLDIDGKHSMRGEVLESAIKEDKAKGLMPYFVCATLGTTSLCSFDAIDEISAVAKQEGLWVNVDAAYAGAALICPEYRYLITNWNGIDSFALSCNKWLMVTADCAVMFVRDSLDLLKTFNVDPLYLKHQYQKEAVDFRHWQIPLCRRFRSLKLWMVFKCYGVAGLQHNIRKQTQQAKLFENLVKSDSRFEVVNDVKMGLVCFRLIGDNSLSEELNNRVNEARKIHMSPAKTEKKYFLRLVVCSRWTVDEDLEFAWNEIQHHANEILMEQK